jgi:hypothetical protein
VVDHEHENVVKEGAKAIDEWRQWHPNDRLLLDDADLAQADLTGANLAGANLNFARLIRAELKGTDLTRTRFGFTSFDGCDLSSCKGLDQATHDAPSHVATDTLLASIHGAQNVLTAELTTFFRGAGVLPELLAMLPRIMATVQYDSCFISYGEPDRAIAERLYRDLQARGASCWLYAFDATPGARTRHEFKTKLREADRMVLLCSAQSLVREGVLTELEEVIDDNPEKLVPISTESLWQAPGFRIMRGNRDLGPWLRERNYADFGKDGGAYDEGLRRLLKALKRPPAAP